MVDPAFGSVEVIRSARRSRSVSAQRVDGRLVVRIPAHFSAAQERRWVQTMSQRLLEREARAVRSDDELIRRATQLAEQVLAPRLGWVPEPRSVRWVSNQNTRWGSCTVAAREIRLSHRLQAMPAWVQDQVLLHELAHLVEPTHNAAFKALIAHPDGERADAYLQGWADASRQGAVAVD